MKLGFPEMQEILMRELRLYHYPIAVFYFFADAELEYFRANVPHLRPSRHLTYCQWELAPRMRGETILGLPEDLGCDGARVSFGWQDLDDKAIKGQLKNTVSEEQAWAFQRAKPVLPKNTLKGIALSPLAKSYAVPSLVHFYCDNMQSLFLGIDYMAATDTHPLRPCMTMNSAACGGGVFAWNEQSFNMLPACFGGYSSGKTDRSEINVFIPGKDIEKTVLRLLTRIGKNPECQPPQACRIEDMAAPFPGAHICKNCSRIAFKKTD